MKHPARLVFWLGLVAAVSTVGVASTPSEPQSVWAGVYTAAQAGDGEALYFTHCASCHGEDLGGVEQAPALAGGAFGQKWKGATLKKIFDRVESMPPTKPKSLSGQQYADVLAFLLSASEVPAGKLPLLPDGGALAEIIYSPVRPQQPLP